MTRRGHASTAGFDQARSLTKVPEVYRLNCRLHIEHLMAAVLHTPLYTL